MGKTGTWISGFFTGMSFGAIIVGFILNKIG